MYRYYIHQYPLGPQNSFAVIQKSKFGLDWKFKSYFNHANIEYGLEVYKRFCRRYNIKPRVVDNLNLHWYDLEWWFD